MKNVSTIQSYKTDSPKTPGGISRSLLTPCRRVGLSRNFKKSGALPFQSPLSSKTEVKRDKIETRKRKKSLEETLPTPENADECGTTSKDQNIQTPSRKVELPRRKKSKTLLASINKDSEENEPSQEKVRENFEDNTVPSVPCKSTDTENKEHLENMHKVSSKEIVTPLRLKSRSRAKNKIALSKSISEQPETDLEIENLANNSKSKLKENEQEQSKENSPNNLTRECIVVIQKKIFRKELKEKQKSPTAKEKLRAISPKPKIASQPVFDSDSDDVPLNCLNKDIQTKPTILNAIDEDDDDFDISKTKTNRLVKAKSKTKIKSPATKIKSNPKVEVEILKVPDSQNSDDDEDFFEKKKTILIKKSYDKVTKPHKAKSTGSITQKDIDDLKARIETKKKMLLARAMTEDTKELRDLIKKWQKGCQDALMELMDLMKSKFSDKQNMDYSEILETLKIPSSLVGYDSDNDCFLTPNDENIILAKV